MSGWGLCDVFSNCLIAYAQQTEVQPSSPGTIHVETREVLVDTVVTDKKGNYVRDLAEKDFKVWEDGKEQTLSSFSSEESTGPAIKPKSRYMVLFFDNSTMNVADQAQARIAAGKFIDANAGPDRLIAIADFGGSLHISQDFTADAERLRQVVKGVQGSSVSPNGLTIASLATPATLGASLTNAEADFGIRTVLLALRGLAKGLAGVPGRKTLVMLTSGFVMDPEYQSELTAVIDTCNKSNVAIYPIDVRGLVTPDMGSSPHSEVVQPTIHSSGSLVLASLHSSPRGAKNPTLQLAAFAEPAVALDPQHGGGGGTGGGGGHGGGGTGGGGTGGGGGGSHGGGGGTGGGGTTGGSGGKTGGGGVTPVSTNTGVYNPYTQPRQIVPAFPPSASNNQQVLYQLADGTGGFVIVNTNDLLGGLERIAKDQNQYYLLGYKPTISADGSCHTLKIKVERSGTSVRARSGYCNSRPLDFLAGNTIEKDLENRAAGEMKGNVSASMEAPFFYTSANTAQVHLALDIPPSALKFEKVKGKEHASVNVLGIAYKGTSESIAARFSDTVSIDLDGKKEVEEFQKLPYHYQNQFGIASGEYKLRVVFSSHNDSFGKVEVPLSIEPYGDQEFSMSGVALSNNIRPAAGIATDLDGELLQDKTPLLVQGMQISPSASNRFKKTDAAGLYAEIYEPLLKTSSPPAVAFELKIVDKNGQEKFKTRNRAQVPQPGNPVIPLGIKLPVSTLDPGSYHVTLQAGDTLGHLSKVRTADFEVE
jgi:VWFA-related protein